MRKTTPIPLHKVLDPQRFWSKAHLSPSGCLLWTSGAESTGTHRYGTFYIGKRDRYAAHRVAYELTHGQGTTDGWCVLHSCDTPLCVSPEHLRLGTDQDNTRDAMERGRLGARTPRKKGRTAGPLRLPEWLVMVEEHQQGLTYRELAARHDLSRDYVKQLFSQKPLPKKLQRELDQRG